MLSNIISESYLLECFNNAFTSSEKVQATQNLLLYDILYKDTKNKPQIKNEVVVEDESIRDDDKVVKVTKGRK